MAEEARLLVEEEQAAAQEERNFWIEEARKWRDEMEKYFHASQEELEFYEFKKSLKETMLESATDEFRAQYEEEVRYAKDEIRWIQQRIGDEERALNEAENALNYEISYDASIRSE